MDDKEILEALTEDDFDRAKEKSIEDHTEYACTVVSLLPFELNEEKPHMLPSSFIVPAANGDKFGILHVREGVHYIPNPLMDEGKPGSSIRQVTPPSEMARSICDDYNCAHVALSEGAQPGLFWVPGKLSQKDVEKFHRKRLESNRKMQKAWFHNLCIMADADWEKNHDMRAVSDLQRAAAKYLGINKEWVEFRMEEMTKCVYCNSSVSPEASICQNCHQIINRTKYEATKKQFDPSDLFTAKEA